MQIVKGKLETAQRVVIYGPAGIGKTTIASKFPNPVYIDTEGSSDELDVARTSKPTSWPLLISFIDNFIKDRQGFQTLIIDTVDWAENLCTIAVLAEKNKKSVEDFGYGKGFTLVHEEFCRLLDKLDTLSQTGMNIVLIAHSQVKKFTLPEESGSYDRYEMKLLGSNSAKVQEWAKMILFVNYKIDVIKDDKSGKSKGEGGKRVIYTTPNPVWIAKNRHNLPEELPLDYKGIASVIPSLGAMEVKKEAVKATAPTEVKAIEKVEGRVGHIDKTAFNSKLYDLMQANNVTAEEIQIAVSSKGYYPADMPIDDYDAEFVDGVLIAAWEQVFGLIQNKRNEV